MSWLIRTAVEAVVVVLLACGAGLAWNHYSDEGLNLTRNYFPTVPVAVPQAVEPAPLPSTPEVPVVPTEPRIAPSVPPAAPGTPPDSVVPVGAATTPDPVAGTTSSPPVDASTPSDASRPGESYGLDAHGLNTVSTSDAVDYHSIPGYAVFIDARSRELYDDGHITGAYYLNHYQSQKLIDGIRPDLEAADVLIVYCGGGSCEDSILLATSLISEYGFPHERVHVYLGGYKEWKAGGNPVTKGPGRE